MNQRARALWRRHASLLMAVLLHAGLLWLVLQSVINQSEPPPSDAVEVSIVPPQRPPKPKPIRAAPAVHPAETNSSEGRPRLEPAPRLARVFEPSIHLTLPDPMVLKPPMALPAASGSPATGAPANGAGGHGAGAGNGSQEGNDYFIRLNAYIDARKGGARHREPNDIDVELILDPDGRLTDIHIVASSGDPAVDDEIMTELRGMSPFPKPPPILFSPSKPLLPVVDKWIFPRP
jgi:TonB family protein